MSNELSSHGKTVVQALQSTLETAVKQLEFSLTQDSEVSEKDVIEYKSLMRVDGMTKFNGPCFICGYMLFRTAEDQKAKQPCGTFIVFFEEEIVEKILKKLGHRNFDEEDTEFLSEHLGAYAKELAAQFAGSLSSLGLSGLLVSDVIANANSIPEGINFPYSVYQYQEAALYLWGKKAIVGNAIMAAS